MAASEPSDTETFGDKIEPFERPLNGETPEGDWKKKFSDPEPEPLSQKIPSEEASVQDPLDPDSHTREIHSLKSLSKANNEEENDEITPAQDRPTQGTTSSTTAPNVSSNGATTADTSGLGSVNLSDDSPRNSTSSKNNLKEQDSSNEEFGRRGPIDDFYKIPLGNERFEDHSDNNASSHQSRTTMVEFQSDGGTPTGDEGVKKEGFWAHMRAALWWCSRERYSGSLLYNLAAFAIPALYETGSKLWVAKVDSTQVDITDVYTYILVIASVLNDGLPRAAWNVIGDNTIGRKQGHVKDNEDLRIVHPLPRAEGTRSVNSQISLSYTLILVQMVCGLIITGVLVMIAPQLADTFIPGANKQTAVTYVRISSIVALTSALEVAVSNSTRALDRPDVPLIISVIKIAFTLVLDGIVISRARQGENTPVVNHAIIRMVCNLVSGVCGLIYFMRIVDNLHREDEEKADLSKSRPCFAALEILLRHGVWTLGESIIRNSLYLWLVHSVVGVGPEYATAFGVFNTIRYGILMVPLQAIETSTATFVGHNWGKYMKSIENHENEPGEDGKPPKEGGKAKPKPSIRTIFEIISQVWSSCTIAFIVESFFFLSLYLFGIKNFASFLSGNDGVAATTEHMWRTMDWCYLFFAISYPLSTILLATTPRFFFLQGLVANAFWLLPWAAACSAINMTGKNPWTYHGIALGGSLVAGFVSVVGICFLWGWMLHTGRVPLEPVSKDVEVLKPEKKSEKNSAKTRKLEPTNGEGETMGQGGQGDDW